jgi:hypothetical protein
MQNWNQWQLSAGAVTTSVPQPPVGYAATPGADPMALMQSYMQYYNQPVGIILNKNTIYIIYRMYKIDYN